MLHTLPYSHCRLDDQFVPGARSCVFAAIVCSVGSFVKKMVRESVYCCNVKSLLFVGVLQAQLGNECFTTECHSGSFCRQLSVYISDFFL